MTQTPAPVGDICSHMAAVDCTPSALEFVHWRLVDAGVSSLTWESRLMRLAAAFGAEAAGLAVLLAGATVVQYRAAAGGHPAPFARSPWEEQPEALVRVQGATCA